MEEERISKLPDEILRHILSKVDIEEAVGTSILSKRWKNVWSSLPNLSFSYVGLAYQSGVNLVWSHSYDIFMGRFEHFVTQFLFHRDHNSAIRKFQLSSSVAETCSGFVDECLDYAINHGVQHLDLDVFCYHMAPLQFPDSLFASKTLRVLKLKQCGRGVVIPKPFILSSLKTLYLERFAFNDDDDDLCSFPKEAFSSFPNLEKLTLHRCEVSGLIISASKLRMLEISSPKDLFSDEEKIEKISTPMFTSFRYEGYLSLVHSKADFPCLEEVCLDIFPVLKSPYYTDDIKKKMPLNMVRMVQQLGNAKFVTLTLITVEVLEMDLHVLEQSPSPFPHPKCLKLTKRPHMTSSAKIVPQTVMNYVTKGSSYGNSLVVKFSEGGHKKMCDM